MTPDVENHTGAPLRPIEDIEPYGANPKAHPDEQVDKIASSIRRFGWDQEIVVDGEGVIIKGHGRRLAALQLGLDEVPVLERPDLTEAEARAARIADNRVAESDWDDELLAVELDLIDESPLDLEVTGFDPDEIDTFLDDWESGDPVHGPALDYEPGSLRRDFGVPPFSVLDTRKSYWTERRERWDSIGAGIAPAVDHIDDGAYQTHGEDNLVGGILNEFGHSIGREAGLLAGRGPDGSIMTGEWQENVGKDNAGLGGNYDGTSTFDPVLAELLYRWFSPDGEDVTILDPFAGGPARAFVAAVLGRRYVGVDINPEQVEANRGVWDEVVEPLRDESDAWAALPRPRWVEGDSADLDTVLDESDVDVGEPDLVFSCPPYHDLERYTDLDGDLSNMDYEEFIQTYRQIIARCLDCLKPDRFAAFVVSDIRDSAGAYRSFPGETVRAFVEAREDVHLYNEAVLINQAASLPARARNMFDPGRKLGRQHQNVLVFWKGDSLEPHHIGSHLGGTPEFGETTLVDDEATGGWSIEIDEGDDDDA